MHIRASLPGTITAAAADGEQLRFSGTLVRAETNLNFDRILPEELDAIAATVPNMALTEEHENLAIGFFMGGTRVGDQVDCDMTLWASRFPETAAEVLCGWRGLSIECYAESAECSLCGRVYTSWLDECLCVANRFGGSGAARILHGLKCRGGGVVRYPAGTDTVIRQETLQMVASQYGLVKPAVEPKAEVNNLAHRLWEAFRASGQSVAIRPHGLPVPIAKASVPILSGGGDRMTMKTFAFPDASSLTAMLNGSSPEVTAAQDHAPAAEEAVEIVAETPVTAAQEEAPVEAQVEVEAAAEVVEAEAAVETPVEVEASQEETSEEPVIVEAAEAEQPVEAADRTADLAAISALEQEIATLRQGLAQAQTELAAAVQAQSDAEAALAAERLGTERVLELAASCGLDEAKRHGATLGSMTDDQYALVKAGWERSVSTGLALAAGAKRIAAVAGATAPVPEAKKATSLTEVRVVRG